MIRMLKPTLLIIAVFSFSLSGIKSQTTASFQQFLDNQITEENTPGVLVSVISRGKAMDWSGAAGYADKENKTPLLPHQTFRIASVTKTFVAAAILRLWEDGKLKLTDPINQYISAEHTNILKKGGYDPAKITIYHLLTHSSGMAEHTQTEKYQMPYLKTNHSWTRTEQLLELINFTKPIGELGQQFSYSDSGYILLGEIIENITKKSLGAGVEQLLRLKKLGLKSIHFENPNGEYGTDRIHQYLDGEDTYAINPTIDLYGGGGLLASARDLSLFFMYLFENKVFRKESTLEKMLEPVQYSKKQPLDYRIGIWETEIEGLKAYTHSGFWGTQVIYIPDLKTSIAANYSQRWNRKKFPPIMPVIVAELKK